MSSPPDVSRERRPAPRPDGAPDDISPTSTLSVVAGASACHQCADLAARVERLERRLGDLVHNMAEAGSCSEVWECLEENDRRMWAAGPVHPDDDPEPFVGF